jgi:RNA polymerase sigma factor (sigma-70 family)
VTPEEHNARFEEWISAHAAILHHVANGFADPSDRNDLMQELLIAVWKAVPFFRKDARPSTFMFRVAHNVALTWRRGHKNYLKHVDAFSADVSAARPTNSSDREQETLEMLYAQIRRLPPVDRSLILLHLDGASYAEISELHGLSESNVGTRLTRIKQRLCDSMKEVSRELR